MKDNMPATPGWFREFAEHHANRCPCGGRWPKIVGGVPTEEWLDIFDPMVMEFVRHGVTKDVAETASALMSVKAHSLPGAKHLQEFMGYVNQVWSLGASAAEVPRTREEAERRSRHCPECCGGGLTTRTIRPEFLPAGTPAVRNNLTRSWYCLCPAGEWIAEHHRKDSPEIFARLRRLAQHPELWDNRLGHLSWPVIPVSRDWPIESCWDVAMYENTSPVSLPIRVDFRRGMGKIGEIPGPAH